jgi:acetyl esterase/lipase
VTIESGPSTAARLLTLSTRLTVRTALKLGSCAARLPWPFGAIEFLAGFWPKPPAHRSTIELRNAEAELVRAPGVERHTGRVVLYFHGGGFLSCGSNTHAALLTRLSRHADAPVLAVNYRLMPNPMEYAIHDGLDAYEWLRTFYEPHEIVLAGDSAGGFLALSVAKAVNFNANEVPAGLALMSPLLQLDPEPKKAHPNIRSDAMFGPAAFDSLYTLVKRANEGFAYEPLDSLLAFLPPTLIHVSGDEALLHDAHLGAERLRQSGAEVELVTWPGQIHVFQIAAPLIPEANRSLEQIGRFVIESTKKSLFMPLTDRTATVGS